MTSKSCTFYIGLFSSSFSFSFLPQITAMKLIHYQDYRLLGCDPMEFSTCVPLCQITWNYIPQDFTLNTHHCRSHICVNKKVQLDAAVCRHLFTAKSLYMFRASQRPSSGALRTVTAASGIGHNTGTATSFRDQF